MSATVVPSSSTSCGAVAVRCTNTCSHDCDRLSRVSGRKSEHWFLARLHDPLVGECAGAKGALDSMAGRDVRNFRSRGDGMLPTTGMPAFPPPEYSALTTGATSREDPHPNH